MNHRANAAATNLVLISLAGLILCSCEKVTKVSSEKDPEVSSEFRRMIKYSVAAVVCKKSPDGTSWVPDKILFQKGKPRYTENLPPNTFHLEKTLFLEFGDSYVVESSKEGRTVWQPPKCAFEPMDGDYIEFYEGKVRERIPLYMVEKIHKKEGVSLDQMPTIKNLEKK